MVKGLAMKDSSEVILPLHRWEKRGLRIGRIFLTVLIPKQKLSPLPDFSLRLSPQDSEMKTPRPRPSSA